MGKYDVADWACHTLSSRRTVSPESVIILYRTRTVSRTSKEAQRILTYAPSPLLLWPDRREIDCSGSCARQQPCSQNLQSQTMVTDHSEAQVYTTLHIVDLPWSATQALPRSVTHATRDPGRTETCSTLAAGWSAAGHEPTANTVLQSDIVAQCCCHFCRVTQLERYLPQNGRCQTFFPSTRIPSFRNRRTGIGCPEQKSCTCAYTGQTEAKVCSSKLIARSAGDEAYT